VNLPAAIVLALTATVVFAQWRGRRGWGTGSESYIPPDARTARQVESHSTETPTWTNTPGFSTDTFTFTRLRYQHNGFQGGGWATDCPDSDLNLSFRVQQMTSIRVDPDGRLIHPTDPELTRYPFLYIVEPGALSLDPAEASALRDHLNNGGFLLLDDFWGEEEWDNAERVLAEVLPGRKFVELSLDHPLYSCVFKITSKGQVPNYRTGIRSQFDPEGRTWERDDATEVHHRAILDDHGRIMVLALHNTDNGDGWEREGENDYYFHNFSEKISYPLGVNIIHYVMTH
jgi:hypothetical protein